MTSPPSRAARLLESFVDQTATRLKAAAVLGHGGETGRAREAALRELLRSFLPPSLGISTGFVIDAHGSKSRQQDIIVHFADFHAVFDVGGTLLVPVEAVIAVFEVKSKAASRSVIHDCYDNLASVKSLDRSNGGTNLYLIDRFPQKVPEGMWSHFQFQIFAGVLAMGAPKMDLWLDATREWCRGKDRSVWPNFYCGIDDYIGAYNVPRSDDDELVGLGPDPSEAMSLAAWSPTGESPLGWAVQEILNFVRVAQRIDYSPTSYLSNGRTKVTDIATRPLS